MKSIWTPEGWKEVESESRFDEAKRHDGNRVARSFRQGWVADKTNPHRRRLAVVRDPMPSDADIRRDLDGDPNVARRTMRALDRIPFARAELRECLQLVLRFYKPGNVCLRVTDSARRVEISVDPMADIWVQQYKAAPQPVLLLSTKECAGPLHSAGEIGDHLDTRLKWGPRSLSSVLNHGTAADLLDAALAEESRIDAERAAIRKVEV